MLTTYFSKWKSELRFAFYRANRDRRLKAEMYKDRIEAEKQLDENWIKAGLPQHRRLGVKKVKEGLRNE